MAQIRLVSTQFIEAGVDIDFPIASQALAGLDFIVQAGGRGKQEGRLEQGDVYVVVTPKRPPPGQLRMAEQTTRILWGGLPVGTDPIGVERFADFFRKRNSGAQLDEKDICRRCEGDVMFRTAEESFRPIDKKTVPPCSSVTGALMTTTKLACGGTK